MPSCSAIHTESTHQKIYPLQAFFFGVLFSGGFCSEDFSGGLGVYLRKEILPQCLELDQHS